MGRFLSIISAFILLILLTACHQDVQFSEIDYHWYSFTDGMIDELKIDFDKRILKAEYYERRYPEQNKKWSKTLILDSEQLKKWQQLLNKAEVDSWDDYYDNNAICGSIWRLKYILSTGETRAVGGRNNWPDEIFIIRKAIQKAVGKEK